MTVTDAPTPIGAGAHPGTSLTIGGGSSSESASISWVLRSINDAEGPRVLPRTLALICEDGAWLIDDDDANAFGVGDTFAEALEEYKDSLAWLTRSIGEDSHEINLRQAAHARSMLDALLP